MPETKGITAVISCLDPNVFPHVFHWAEDTFGIGNFTFLTIRGAELYWTQYDEDFGARHIERELQFIAQELGLERIVFVPHSDCKALEKVGKLFINADADYLAQHAMCEWAIHKLSMLFKEVLFEIQYFRKDLKEMKHR